MLQAKIHGCYKPFSYWFHGCYKPFAYWLHETAACCYSGVDLGNGLDHNSLSRSADGTLHSSSDLPYLLLYSSSPFYLDKIILSPTPFLPFSSWTKIFQVQFLFSLLLDKNLLSPTSILQNYSKTILNSVLAATSVPLRKIILRQFQILS